MNSSTAILLFTRTAKEESQKKHFAQGGNLSVNRSISSSLIKRTIREVRKSRVPFFVLSSDQQHGSSFGERLSNAFSEVFNLGYRNVIAVGNDAPQLSTFLLQAAARSLEENGLVLGPDQRGGAYLIGISKPLFNAEAFEAFSWNSSNLFSDLIDWSKTLNSGIEVLAELSDVNNASDFDQLLRNKRISLSFLKQLQSIVASVIYSFAENTVQFYFLFFGNSISRRGPPLI